MTRPIRILLQIADDWSIARFGKLAELLRRQRTPDGGPTFDIVARDRGPTDRPDPVLSRLDRTDFDELWLFAVDAGDGLAPEDCEAVTRFRQAGRGLMISRDHMDLGSSICSLVGSARRTISTRAIPIPMRLAAWST